MNSKIKIVSVTAIALVATLLIVNTVTSVLASSKGHRAGVRDGLDHPFSEAKLDKFASMETHITRDLSLDVCQ